MGSSHFGNFAILLLRLITCCNLHFELCNFITPNSTEPCKHATLSLSLSLSDYTTQKKDLNCFLGEEEQEKRDFFVCLQDFFFFWVVFIFLLSLHGKYNRHENANFSSPWAKFPHRPITSHVV
jgi:hypothetical protein